MKGFKRKPRNKSVETKPFLGNNSIFGKRVYFKAENAFPYLCFTTINICRYMFLAPKLFNYKRGFGSARAKYQETLHQETQTNIKMRPKLLPTPELTTKETVNCPSVLLTPHVLSLTLLELILDVILFSTLLLSHKFLVLLKICIDVHELYLIAFCCGLSFECGVVKHRGVHHLLLKVTFTDETFT
jgi:hypothetical protein